MDELIFAGNKYISSKRASKVTGYTTDYIGQICRADKIECRLVGRNWYIKEKDLEKNKKSFKKEQGLNHKKQEGAIGYEKISPELLYYSNDKRSLNPEISKTHIEEGEGNSLAGGEENNEKEIPIRIIENPRIPLERYTPRPIQRQTVRRQPIVPQQAYRGFPMVASIALVLMLAGVLLIAGTLTLEQVVYYSSKDKKNLNTSIQLANVQEIFRFSAMELFEL